MSCGCYKNATMCWQTDELINQLVVYEPKNITINALSPGNALIISDFQI